MPNLNLTYSGNMNITSASLTSAGTLNVQYEPNNTGSVTGFTFIPPEGSEFVCGETYTLTAIPKYGGTVLTENFTITGVDVAGIQRSDTAVLRQEYDNDLTHYELNLASVGATIISSSVTSTYLELVISIDNDEYAEIDIQPGQGSVIVYPIDNITDGSGPDTGTVVSSLTLVVADSITGSGIASAIWSPAGATVSLRYQSNSPAYATIDQVTGVITVLQTGDVRFTVFDDITGLFDSKVVHCYKEGEGPDTGDTGTVINFLAINVPAYIWNTGYVGAQYSPDYAEVDLHYTSNLPAVASVNEQTGQVTVHQTGNVTFCVTDTRSGLSDCMPVNVGIIEPDTGVSATAITINVPDTITDSGLATTTVEPYNADVNLYYTYEDTDIIGANRASIDRYTGQINVRSTGTARFCVEDRYTGLKDCKVVNVVKTNPDTGGTDTYWFRVTYRVIFNNKDSVDVLIARESGWRDLLWGNAMAFTEKGRRLEMNIRSSSEWGELVGTTFYKDLDAPQGYVSGYCRINVYYVSSGNTNNLFCGTVPSYFGVNGSNLILSDNFRSVGEFCGIKTVGAVGEGFYVPVGCVIGPQDWGGSFFSVYIPGPMYYNRNGGRFRFLDNSCFSKSRYLLPNDDKQFNVYVPEEYIQDYLDYYNEWRNNNMTHPWEGWVSPITGSTPTPDFEIPYVTSMTINGSSVVTDYEYFTYSYAPSNAFRDIRWHSSDENIATVGEKNGLVKVVNEGTVIISIEDVVSGLIQEKTIYAQKTSSTVQGRFAIIYDVTSTTENTLITTGNYTTASADTAYFSKAELADGTEIPLTDSSTRSLRYYRFPSTGLQIVYYTVKPGITNINAPIFSGTSVVEAVIPYGVTSIGDQNGGYLFAQCYKLTSVSLPQTLVSIGMGCFHSCPIETIELPNSLRFLGYRAFLGAQISSIDIPDSVEEIGDYCFFMCDNASAVTIGSSVLSMGQYAFDGVFPVSFTNNSSLDEVSNNYWGATLVDEFTEDGLAIKNNIIVNCKAKAKNVVIPDYVTGVKQGWNNTSFAFSACTMLESVYIGSGITQINNWFTGISTLKSIYISDSVTLLYASAFTNCTALTAVTIPDSVTTVGTYAFSGCTSLKNVVIGDGLTSLSGFYFSGSTSLENVELGEGITEVPDRCFAGSTSLKSVTLPATLTRLKDNVFSGCTQLQDIYSYKTSYPATTTNTFNGVPSNGRLYYPANGNYSRWLSTSSYYKQLGYYGWTGYDIL